MWRKLQKSLSTAIPSLLLAASVGLAICYLNRWDIVTAATLIPPWAWAGVGMLLCLLSWIAFRGLYSLIVFCVFLGAGIAFSEESHSLFRELTHTVLPGASEHVDALTLRVITINAAGSIDAVKASLELDPDLVLIQESPPESDLGPLCESQFGPEYALFGANDLAIAGNGMLVSTLIEEHGHAIHARIAFHEKFIVDSTSLQLLPNLPTPHLWDLRRWKKVGTTRIANRHILRKTMGENPISRPLVARVIGGDFYTLPDDAVFKPFEYNGLSDVFAAKGTGWGNTFPSEFPVFRLDQLWTTSSLKPLSVETKKVAGTDHRIVVADFVLPIREEK